MIAEVEGVLTFNNETRDEMLKRNIGKYSQWNFALNPAIGEYYDIDYNRSLKDLKDGKSLLSYTHDGKSEYSEEIQRKFFSFGEGEEYYVRPLTYGELNPWVSFQKGNYIQYIDEVFGKDDVMRHVDYVNNLLSGQFIENALRQTEVGVIKDINVAVAMQGIITTNPNNMSGEDTTLGKISNRMYAQTLYNGAKFNSNRMKAKIRDGENFYNKSYITPYLVNQYGNNLANVFELSDKMKIGVNETAIREDLGKDVHILDGYTEGRFADLSSDEFRFLREQTENVSTMLDLSRETLTSKNPFWPMHRYSMVDGKGYVNWSKLPNSFRYKNRVDDGYPFKPGVDNAVSGRKSGPYTYGMYNENLTEVSRLYNSQVYRKTLDETELKKLESSYNDISNITNSEITQEPNQFNSYDVITDSGNTLLAKTAKLFNNQQLDTLIARFHTDKDVYTQPEFTDTARSMFGNSHGRNLLVRDAATKKPETNGYSNPYCRTWTYHHQYNQVKKLIRPFIYEDGGEERAYTNKEIQAMNKKYRAYRNDGSGNAIFGYESLADNTVLQSNGFVRITPKSDDKTNDIRKCMFSIENLAWKDVLKHEDNISKEQTGPNGGRIMWFPPYNLDFQEGVNVSWQSNTFIGRGENVYTYTNTERTGTLSFSLLIDHPAIMNSVSKNSYAGMPDEQDAEADILRFFAGCELLTEPDKITPPEKVPPTEPPKQKVKEGNIKFRIYFPNNFSGIVSNKDVSKVLIDDFNNYVIKNVDDPNTEDSNAYKGEMANDYWWQYILVGNNTCIVTDESLFRGYEMQVQSEEHSGLYDEGVFTDITLPTCQKNLYEVGDVKKVMAGATNTCSIGPVSDDSNLRYHYQIDTDLHQKLNDVGSYIDDNSFQLNSSFSWREKNNKAISDCEYTFAEVIMALLDYNKTISSNNGVNYGDLYDVYKPYIIDRLHVDEARIKKLSDLFKNDKVKYTSLTYTASADNNDTSNSAMLAKRRGINGYNTLKRLLPKLNEASLLVSPSTITGGNSNVPAYTEEQKINRFCEFVITYTMPAENLSDTASGKGTPQENEETSGITFEYYLELLCDNSDFISVASNYDPTFIDRLEKERYNTIENKQTYVEELENDYEKLKEEVEVVFNNFIDLNTLALSSFIADSTIGCNQDYRTKTNGNDAYNPSDVLTSTIRQRIKNLWDGGTDLVSGTTGNLKFVIPDLGNMYTYFFGVKPNTQNYSSKIQINDPLTSMTNFPLREMIYDENGNERLEGDDRNKYTTTDFSALSLVIDGLICQILWKYTEHRAHFYEFADELNKTGVYKDVRDLITTYFQYECTSSQLSDNAVRDIYYNIHLKIQSITIPSLKERLIHEEEEKRRQEEEAQALILEQKKQEERKKKEKEEEERKKRERKERIESSVVYAKDNIPNTRYETEAEYFNTIDVKDPLLYKNLKDKFKYFNPAYHSISPEGFNARLTFLHQCTRQGQTQEMKSTNNTQGYTGTASNLAFGRMPVCVIRIGDFINARCIINNMTISYASDSGMLWDLNPEGAGVQPMYANISLGITLLGGQSLGAPISRLQNAISFNYYANTEAYDNRADVAIYEADNEGNTSGNVIYKRLWSPLSKDKDDKLFSNDTKDFEKQHEDDGNWDSKTTKPLTDEQIDEKFNGDKEKQESGSTEDTKVEPLVESQELRDYVLNDSAVYSDLVDYFEHGATLQLKMLLNQSYVESGYVYAKYNNHWDYSLKDVSIKSGMLANIDDIYEELESDLKLCVRQFVNTHNG